MAAGFDLGTIRITPGAITAFTVAGEHPLTYVARHARGDWGDLDADDKKANEDALIIGARLLSAYHLRSGERVWIISEADRSSTTVLLPHEY